MFQNREDAGELLSKKLTDYKKRRDAIVMAVPRGGVVVSRVVADKLSLFLYPLVIKKLGHPNNPELAIGALAPGNTKYVDWDLALRSGIEQDYLDKEIEIKRKKIEERIEKYQISKIKSQIQGKNTFILIDDGIATGATTLAAIKYIKSIKPPTTHYKPITILAVPVVAKETYNILHSQVDKIIALEIPESFGAVGQFYKEFPQVSDEEVIKLLK